MIFEENEVYEFRTVCPDILTPSFVGFKLYHIPLVMARAQVPELDNIVAKVSARCGVTDDINNMKFYLAVNESNDRDNTVLAEEWIDSSSVEVASVKSNYNFTVFDTTENDRKDIYGILTKLGYKVSV